MSTVIDVAELFQQAEEFRVQGPAAAAIQLYWAVSRRADGELKINAEHMLGVTYSMLGRPLEADAVLEELLDSNQVPQQSILRGNILRDQAKALQQLGDTASALAIIRESIDILSDHGPKSLSGLAASTGFLSRFLAAAGKLDEAETAAAEANIVFSQLSEPAMQFYHNCWCAELLVYLGRDEFAREMAYELKAKQDLFVNERHHQRLQLIIEHADDPEGLKAELAKL